jgi:cyclic pyranopterin phosphate synthase
VGGVREGDEPRRAAELAFTHVDESGRARMVDVTGKPVTERRATARCVLRSSPDALEAAAKDEDFVPFAKATGIQGAKRTPSLIPLCHPLPLDDVDVRVDLDTASGTARLQVSTSVVARTGIEVEALTACAFAGLTLLMSLRHYDPDAVLTTLALWHKSGGRSGTWERAPGPASRDDRGGAATDPGGEPGPRSS